MGAFPGGRFLVTLLLAAAIASCSEPTIDSTTRLEDTRDQGGPYEIWSVVRDVQSDDFVELFVSFNSDDPEDFAPFLMEGDESGGTRGELFVAAIGGQSAGTVIRYFVAVTRDHERLAEDPAGGDIQPYAFQIQP